MGLKLINKGQDCIQLFWRQFNLHTKAFCLSCIFLIVTLFESGAAEFYVSPTGSPGGDGTWGKPWDLPTALKHPNEVQPGDTIWLRGGVYRKNNKVTKFYSELQGAANHPITLRQFPGERAVIDGNITQTAGGWVNYWGFEIMNSLRTRLTAEKGSFPRAFWVPDGPGKLTDFAVSGIDLRVPNVKLINMIIHDSVGGGIGISTSASNPEIYGTFSFYNGWQGGDRGHGHGIYAQSVDPNVPRVEDNVFFANYALGFQASGTGPVVDNFQLEGNIFFLNSVLSRQHQGNFLLGSGTGHAKRISLIRNFIYETEPSSSDVNIGYVGGILEGVLERNYFATRVAFSANNHNIETAGNTLLADTNPAERPDLVEIRTNKYEPGRAHIIVYNWARRDTVPVDLSDVLPIGTAYQIRSAQDILGPPVLQGTFLGSTVHLPMTNLFVAKPRALNSPLSTAPEFNVFVVLPEGNGAAASNLAPVVSSLANRAIFKNTPTGAIRVTIRDFETPVECLSTSVSSSNPALVPLKNIRFGGSESIRTLTVVPVKDQIGKTVISLAVSDGLKATTRSFVLTVKPRY